MAMQQLWWVYLLLSAHLGGDAGVLGGGLHRVLGVPSFRDVWWACSDWSGCDIPHFPPTFKCGELLEDCQGLGGLQSVCAHFCGGRDGCAAVKGVGASLCCYAEAGVDTWNSLSALPPCKGSMEVGVPTLWGGTLASWYLSCSG